ncbi:putative matrilysin [Helianthus annuus]|nr:putative matrilysin [Helianthus annuus]KAJ0588296.1 putative matrilysin [Helianthus annuus]KAJ0596612.1 putative matrilysin [Helianthus annuus]KAJ0757277.1 putative matrilysin [Helianthus annuus]KAJ0760994.1 putative matrilysin [Helianthus annuus]
MRWMLYANGFCIYVSGIYLDGIIWSVVSLLLLLMRLLQVLNASPLHCVILLIIVAVFSLSSNALPNSPTSDWNTLYNLSGSHSGQEVAGISKLKSYLNQFGYITNNNSNNQPTKFNDYFDDALEHAIKIYQKSFNLNTTGILDSSTINQMVKPRCGVPDIVNGTALMYLS